MNEMPEKLKALINSKEVIFFGATTSARDMLETDFTEINHKIKYICDFDEGKWGTSFQNTFQEVFIKKPEELKSEQKNDIFVLITTLFDGEVETYLNELCITNYISARGILNEKVNVNDYWEDRYKKGYDTGVQSQGFLLEKQIQFVNEVIENHNIEKVFELGCGNGKMLHYLKLNSYVGLDISHTAIDICREKFVDDNNKKFFTLSEYEVTEPAFDLSISLGNVIPSLPDDSAYFKYMTDLFGASSAFVCIFSSDHDSERFGHIKSRNFSKYVSEHFPDWKLVEVKETGYEYKESDPLEAKFFFYQK